MIHRSVKFKVLIAAASTILYLFTSIVNEAKRVDQLELEPVNLSNIANGLHHGGFVYQNDVIEVNIIMESSILRDIQVVKHINGQVYTEGAKELVTEVLSTQNLEYPTNEMESLQERAAKKALLHAIRAALIDAPFPSENDHSPYTVNGIIFLLAFCACCGALGAQLAGYMAFRTADMRSANNWVQIEDLLIFVGTAGFVLGCLLKITG
jgi:hypothetical protein